MNKLDNYWQRRGYTLESFPFSEAEPGDLLLDIGCGEGIQLNEASQNGARVLGLDVDFESLRKCRGRGMPVFQSKAEYLPIKTNALGRLICKGVLPFTEEGSAVSEMGRILQPGGRLQFQGLGLGYYLHYLFFSPVFLTRVYAFLTILNTWIYRTTGRRWRTTVYQSRKRLLRLFTLAGLRVLTLERSKNFLGVPVTFYFQLIKASPGEVGPPKERRE